MTALTDTRDHARKMAGTSTTPAKEAAEWLRTANLLGGLEGMFEYAPNEWWRFVGCRSCNARRQQPCQAMDGPSRRPHAARRDAARVLHGTLWLLANHPEDVLGEEDS